MPVAIIGGPDISGSKDRMIYACPPSLGIGTYYSASTAIVTQAEEIVDVGLSSFSRFV
eukprot:COSAG03_NODE_17546_length_373_cov_0.718978_1_plen_57_part_10